MHCPVSTASAVLASGSRRRRGSRTTQETTLPAALAQTSSDILHLWTLASPGQLPADLLGLHHSTAHCPLPVLASLSNLACFSNHTQAWQPPGSGRSTCQPSQPPRPARFVGPFLRFGGGTGPGSRHWRGSVLCLTRLPAAPAAGAPPPTAATADGAAVPGGADAARSGLPTGAVNPPTREAALAGSGAAAAAAAAAGPPPVLVLEDAGQGHGGAGRQELQAQPLDSSLGWTAWRFDIQLALLEWQRPVNYRVTAGEAVGAGAGPIR